MFFDLHSDILYDIVAKRLEHKKNIIKDYHLKQYHKGEIIGAIWTYYTDINNPLCEFDKAIDLILEELEANRDFINIIEHNNDFDFNKINVLLGFESLVPVKDVNHLDSLYDLGFRHAMLTWNEENKFATGIKGDSNRGLTEKGVEIIKFMNQKGMIIDISHANIITVDNILDISEKPIIASHSNVYTLCPHVRNLQDFQIDAIVEKGGLIGITAVKQFVNPENPTIKEMVKHIEYLRQKNYLNHIGLGFDFMDYFNINNLNDLNNAGEALKLLEAFDELLYSELEVDQISFLNALNIINKLLPNENRV